MFELGLSVLATMTIVFLVPAARAGLARLAQWRAERRQRLARLLQELMETELNAREREILPLIAAGQTNKEIGQRLGVTRERVRQIETNAFSKLQAGFAAKGIGAEQALKMIPSR
jgi:RNA polymerase sigma factor (sigma-70 family)